MKVFLTSLFVLFLSLATFADYATQATLAIDPAFQSRVKIAAFIAAVSIVNEPLNTVNHARRTAFAQTFVHNIDSYISRMALGVAADGTITAASSDAAIQTRVATIWDTFAGKD